MPYVQTVRQCISTFAWSQDNVDDNDNDNVNVNDNDNLDRFALCVPLDDTKVPTSVICVCLSYPKSNNIKHLDDMIRSPQAGLVTPSVTGTFGVGLDL